MRVFVVGSRGNCSYEQMFEEMGWHVTSFIEEADVVQFTGGADVTPALYGEPTHPATSCNVSRDLEEVRWWNFCVRNSLFMAGICRGGQFLNVMNGGSMFQDCEGHAIAGTHLVTDLLTDRNINVTSTHHQIMIPSENGQVIAIARNVSTRKEKTMGWVVEGENLEDTEVVFYPGTKSLCFQPHPEHRGVDECREYYFELLEKFYI